jgi:arsenate reductase-like glutaredoxin family protein
MAKKGHIPWNKGKKGIYSIETIEKMKATLSDGRRKGKNNPSYGKIKSRVTREKISKTRIEKGIAKGSNNPRFIDGRSIFKNSMYNDEIYKMWRNAVFQRDSYICTSCNKKKKRIEAHHIKPQCDYPELIYDIDNGITLCLECHRKTFKDISSESRKRKPDEGFIGFDLDGTLAEYHGWSSTGEIGKPIKKYISLLKNLIAKNFNVKIFTARVCQDDSQVAIIEKWLEENGLPRLEITAVKDYRMSYIVDDRAIQVVRNTGMTLVEFFEEKKKQIEEYHKGVKHGQM